MSGQDSTKCPNCLCEMEYVKTIATANGKDSKNYLPMTGYLNMDYTVIAQEFRCPKCGHRKTIFVTL